MTEKKDYVSPSAFEQAINQKIRNIAKEENYQDPPRLRRHIAFERFLTRLFITHPKDWVLKGGYAMELRLRQARATKDVDMCFRETSRKAPNTIGAPSNHGSTAPVGWRVAGLIAPRTMLAVSRSSPNGARTLFVSAYCARRSSPSISSSS